MGVSSGMIARAFIKLSRVVGLNEYLLSFIVLGAITSLPEIFVALGSLLARAPIVSISNVIGANLVNLTLSIGLVAYLADGIELKREEFSRRTFWLSFLLAMLPATLLLQGGVTRGDGLLLIIIGIGYMVVFAYDSAYLDNSRLHIPYGIHYFSEVIPTLYELSIGILILAVAAVFLLLMSIGMASSLSMSLIIWSTLFLGLATALPELLFGTRGAMFQHPSLSLGNILASVVFNSTLIVGFVAIISPLTIAAIPAGAIYLTCSFTIAAFILLSIFSYTSRRVSQLEGLLLIYIYILFFISVFLIS